MRDNRLIVGSVVLVLLLSGITLFIYVTSGYNWDYTFNQMVGMLVITVTFCAAVLGMLYFVSYMLGGPKCCNKLEEGEVPK